MGKEKVVFFMNKEEFIEIVEKIIQSLKENPDQFHVNVNVSTTGLKVESTGRSTGIRSTVYGGTGIHATAEVGKEDIEIAQGLADKEFKKRLDRLIESLEKIKTEASKDIPDKNRIRRLVDELKLYAPAMIGAVLSKLLDFLF